MESSYSPPETLMNKYLVYVVFAVKDIDSVNLLLVTEAFVQDVGTDVFDVDMAYCKLASSGVFRVMPKVKLVLLDEVLAVHVAAPAIDAFVVLTGSSSSMTTIGASISMSFSLPLARRGYDAHFAVFAYAL